jgi:hypothetical protein
MGKAWAAKGFKSIKHGRRLDGSKWDQQPTTYASAGGGAKKDDSAGAPRDSKRKRESSDYTSISTIHSNYPEAAVLGDLDFTLPVRICLPGHSINTDFLLDSGALNGNYINCGLARRLRALGATPIRRGGKRLRVCAGLGDNCRNIGDVF